MNTLAEPLQQPNAPTPAPGYIIVAQVKSDRVVYFTDDPDFVPVMGGDWYFVSHHLGALPEGMTLRNCWNWRFRGSVFIHAEGAKEKTPAQRLIDYNRDALLKILQEKIQELRAPLLPHNTAGYELRRQKLAQARRFIEQPDSDQALPLLEGAATARGWSLLEAAQLIVERAARTEAMLIETEAVREKMRVAIRAAKTEDELLQLRFSLMNEVYPQLSAKHRIVVPNTTPIDLDKALDKTHRLHELARLTAQLREHVNAARNALLDGYQFGDALAARQRELAQAYLSNAESALAQDRAGLLQMMADAAGLPLEQAAHEVLAQAAARDALLFRTERDKQAMLARINNIATLRDVRNCGAAIRALEWSADDVVAAAQSPTKE